MDKLNKDELFSIAIELDLPSLLKLCSSNKNINERLCLREEIWNYKLREFPDYTKCDFAKKNKREIYTLLYNLNILKRKLKLEGNVYHIYEMEYIWLDGRELIEIPKEIDGLINLKGLYCYNNRLKTIPKEVGNLINLQVLRLSDNLISEIPKEIGGLINLERLYLNYNEIKKIPKEIGDLINLKELHLQFNRIEEIPKEFSKLTNLVSLDLSHNPLKNIPEGLRNLPNLRYSSF